MTSRIAVTAMLVLGLLTSGTGATLAVSGLASSGSASQAQYQSPFQTPSPSVQGGGAPAGDPGAAPGGQAPAVAEPAVAPAQRTLQPEEDGVAGGRDARDRGSATAELQAPRQLAAQGGGEELPFTGFAAMPILLLGLTLLVGGVVLRKASHRA